MYSIKHKDTKVFINDNDNPNDNAHMGTDPL